MAKVKVKFRPSTVKDHPGSIIYLVTHRRVVRQITTGYKVHPSEWDERRSAVIVTDNDRLRMIAQRIRWDMERLYKIINSSRICGYFLKFLPKNFFLCISIVSLHDNSLSWQERNNREIKCT